jgi:hypothetical protein
MAMAIRRQLLAGCIVFILGTFSLRLSFKDMARLSPHVEGTERLTSFSDRLRRPKISYKLFRQLQFHGKYGQGYSCQEGIGTTRMPLPSEMQQPGMFDFFPRISTNLKIIFLGDSVSMQLSQTFDEAVISSKHPDVRDVLYTFERDNKESLTVAAPIRGGGVSVGFRFYNLFYGVTERRRHGRHLAPTRSWVPYGYDRARIYELLNRTYVPLDTTNSNASVPVGKFDVIVRRLPHGWLPLEKLTFENLQNDVEVTSNLFGAKTLIFLTLPFINNVGTIAQYRGMLERRHFLRTISREWRPLSNDTGIQNVLVLEFGTLMDELQEWNARCIGFNTSNGFEDWMFSHRLAKNPKSKAPWYDNIPHKCAELVPDGASECRLNSITYDGMHPCMSTVGGRLVAGLACLIACAHNQELGREELRTCEAECNDRFMSLNPVPEADLIDWTST